MGRFTCSTTMRELDTISKAPIPLLVESLEKGGRKKSSGQGVSDAKNKEKRRAKRTELNT